jgi:hypothetical protein
MENGMSIQQHLFQIIRDTSPHQTLVDIIEEVLGIGQDSAYRRISGKTELTISELHKLCKRFSISADELLRASEPDQITFNYKALHQENFSLLEYLSTAYESLKIMSVSAPCNLIYSATAMPLFDYFHLDEIATFKMFVWQKSICDFPAFENRKFDFDKVDRRLIDTGKSLLRLYQRIPSIELWNMATIDSLIYQLEYYAETDQFANPTDALLIADQLEIYLHHIRRQAESGCKFRIGNQPDEHSGSLEMYHNEVVTADNTILVDVGQRKYTFLTHCATNFLNTSNDLFCDTTYNWLMNLVRRSTLISKASEKQRASFFNLQLQKVKKSKEKLRFLVTVE